MTNTISTLFGQAVRLQGQVLGLSQEELAWRAGLDRSYVTDVERGSHNLPLSTLDKLATALETPPFVSLRDMDKRGRLHCHGCPPQLFLNAVTPCHSESVDRLARAR